MKVILVLDIGTTNIKVTVHDEAGRICHADSEVNPIQYGGEGCVELDAQNLKEKVSLLLRRISTHIEEIGYEPVTISVTASRSSVLPVDEQSEPLRPFMMWQDKRSTDICTQMLPHQTFVYKTSGLHISPVFSAAKMVYLLNNAGEDAPHFNKLIGIQDFIIHFLTGEFVTDLSFAGRTNLFNLKTLTWDDTLLSLFNIKRRQLCDIVLPGSICGSIIADASVQTGLPEGLPVVTAGGDQQCAAIGSGALSSDALLCNVGTGAYLIVSTNRPVLDAQERFFCNPGAIPGTFILEAGLQTGGALYRRISEWFYCDFPKQERYAVMDREIAMHAAGVDGILILPHFSGSGCPHWDPADLGVIYGLSLETKRGAIARAAMEAIAMELAENVDILRCHLNSEDLKVHAAGGMTESINFNRILSDTFKLPVVVLNDSQATARGAWMGAAVSTGLFRSYADAYASAVALEKTTVYTPDAKNVIAYQKLIKKREKLYTLVHEMSLLK